MSFYTYNQNNSGGSFTGPAHYVIIEAPSPAMADVMAQSEGLYFDGEGDCSCCGTRWSAQNEFWRGDEGTEKPEVWGDIDLQKAADDDYDWADIKLNILVVYVDGRREEYRKSK